MAKKDKIAVVATLLVALAFAILTAIFREAVWSGPVQPLLTFILTLVIASSTIIYVMKTHDLVREQRLMRRENAELLVYVHEPTNFEEQILSRAHRGKYYGKAVTIEALLVNPSINPFVITGTQVEIVGIDKLPIDCEQSFVVPAEHPEQEKFISSVPWAIAPNGFAVLHLELFSESLQKEVRYNAQIKLNYENSGCPQEKLSQAIILKCSERRLTIG